MDYAGTSITVNVANKERKGCDLIYVSKHVNGKTDAKTAFIEAMTKFTETEEFQQLSHSLYSDITLQVGHCVHTDMPRSY